LEGLEEAYREAVEQRAMDNVAFSNEPPLLEMWSRDKIENVLKDQRTARKYTVPGWDAIK